MTWFTEKHTPNVGITFKIKQKIFSKKTKFQKIDVIETYEYGKMMLLDNCVMVTDRDEFIYHEMIAHVPLCINPNAKKVLIIGGGDGGAVREVLKHPSIKKVHLCEIDKDVTDIARKYFPTLSKSLNDPRVEIFYEDGLKFIKENNKYDVIMIDSTDPIGPAVNLFRKDFYERVYATLVEDGTAVAQTESPFYHKEIINKLYSDIKTIFPIVKMYTAFIPTYPSGMWSFAFCSKSFKPEDINLKEARLIEKDTKYYNANVHQAAFALPNFAKKLIT